jgi:STE24 endopeptidase
MAFDPASATAQYIDSLGAPALAKAAAYTSGGHWLLLWGLVVTALVTWVFVRSGLLDKVSQRLSGRGPFLRAFLVCACFLLLSSLLTLPWSLYSDWWRETAYGRTSQPLADYLGQAAISLGLSTVIGALFLAGVYALIRRTGARWWLWSGGLAAVGASLLMLLVPMFIQPLFNQYSPVPPGEVRDALVKMADEANIPAERIFIYDGSRQSNNFTANAGGIGSAARIAISDVALKGASLDEVKAVTGHEIGHYVLGHTWRGVAFIAGMAVLFFFLADRLFARFARAFGAAGGIGEPTTLPVLLFIVSVLGLLAQPLSSTVSRWGETEADQYSLRTVNLPDALASALVKTAEYRNPRPGALEEVLFYDHPSVEGRVRMAMDWKAAHPATE